MFYSIYSFNKYQVTRNNCKIFFSELFFKKIDCLTLSVSELLISALIHSFPSMSKLNSHFNPGDKPCFKITVWNDTVLYVMVLTDTMLIVLFQNSHLLHLNCFLFSVKISSIVLSYIVCITSLKKYLLHD